MGNRPDQLYTKNFFYAQVQGSLASAREVVPLVVEFVRPTTVVDVGCGLGAWLSVFRDCGVERVLGVDGDHVDTDSLLIPREAFLAVDLREPVSLGETFDLCVSLEVAEHLPASSASTFVASLAKLAPVVFFSAAVPHQGGTGHVNEQWPAYWSTLFAEEGFVRLDPFRRVLWHNERVEWWYRQNCFLYVADEFLRGREPYESEVRQSGQSRLTLVHEEVLYSAFTLRSSVRRIAHLAKKHLGRGVRRVGRGAGRSGRREFALPRSAS